jgi:hypothetical protein
MKYILKFNYSIISIRVIVILVEWWRDTSSDHPYMISGTNRHPSKTTDVS